MDIEKTQQTSLIMSKKAKRYSLYSWLLLTFFYAFVIASNLKDYFATQACLNPDPLGPVGSLYNNGAIVSSCTGFFYGFQIILSVFLPAFIYVCFTVSFLTMPMFAYDADKKFIFRPHKIFFWLYCLFTILFASSAGQIISYLFSGM
ncbi:hypothetical protein D4R99_00400 [bacterium]|nr:MAG: hypothetical protein D4R99_00400 [bacterium]